MMHKILLIGLALLSFAAEAEVWQARYGVAETFDFKLYNADGTLDVDEADGGTEVSVSCNEGAETTATNDFVDEGTFYSIALTATEMQCERIAVVVAATTTEVFFIQTIDNGSAMTPTIVQTGDSFARLGAPAGASVSADILVVDNFVDDLESRLGTPSNLGGGATVAANLSDIEGQTDDIGVAGAGLTNIDLPNQTMDITGSITGNLSGSVGSVTGAVGSVATGGISEASFATTAGSFDALGIIDQGTAQAATGTTLQLRSAAAFADDEIIGATCLITGGSAGVGQARTITDYVSSTDTATVATWTTTPTGTITYECFGTATSSGGGASAADVWAYATRSLTILDEDSTTLDLNATAVGSVAGAVGSVTGAVGSVTGNVTGSVGSVATGGITAASIATGAVDADAIAPDAGTEIANATWALDATGQQTQGSFGQAIGDPAADTDSIWSLANSNLNATVGSRASQTSVDTIDDFVDTEVAAILADTGTDGVVVATASKTGYALSAAGVDAIWDESQSGHVTAGTFGLYLDAPVSSGAGGGLDAAGVRAAIGLATANLDTQLSGIQSDTNDIQTRLPAALVSGRIDSSTGAMAANVMTAAAAAADLTTELQSGLATSSAVSSIDTKLGTPAGASMSADTAAVKSDTAAILVDTTEIGVAGAGLTAADDATLAAIEQTARIDAAIINCEVNTANFAGSTTTVACILTDRDGGAVSVASNDLEGRELLILSGSQIYEGRFIIDSTWDAANSELRLTLSRALPGTLADAVTAIIR